MQNNTYSAAVHGGFAIGTTAMPTSLNSQYESEGDGGFTSLYSGNASLPSSLSVTPCADSDYESVPTAINYDLYHYRLIIQHQELVNLHHLCLSQLREASREAEALREENIALRSVNRELKEQLSETIQASVQNQLILDRSYTAPFDIANAFRCLCIGHEGRVGCDGGNWDEVSDGSPTSVMENGRSEGTEVQRISLPKSISVRSNGYLKMNQAGGGGVNHHGGRARSRAVSPLGGTKVYVPGGKKEEEPLELEVYNQGMFKTELCNKWQQTGTCPYGDNCQFAHGVEELRPVIRHPRYKTEVCKMLLAGGVCPYGHRCHFRHALTEREKFMASLQDREN